MSNELTWAASLIVIRELITAIAVRSAYMIGTKDLLTPPSLAPSAPSTRPATKYRNPPNPMATYGMNTKKSGYPWKSIIDQMTGKGRERRTGAKVSLVATFPRERRAGPLGRYSRPSVTALITTAASIVQMTIGITIVV